jgi:hypothetical protein
MNGLDSSATQFVATLVPRQPLLDGKTAQSFHQGEPAD